MGYIITNQLVAGENVGNLSQGLLCCFKVLDNSAISKGAQNIAFVLRIDKNNLNPFFSEQKKLHLKC